MPVLKELPLVPAERTLRVIGGRWKVFVLYHLFDGPKRLSELRRLIPDVSQKVLVQQLREMEAHGVVHREVFAEVPPRVVYRATRLGLSLKSIVGALCDWGKRHAGELEQATGRGSERAPGLRAPRTRAATPRRPRGSSRRGNTPEGNSPT